MTEVAPNGAARFCAHGLWRSGDYARINCEEKGVRKKKWCSMTAFCDVIIVAILYSMCEPFLLDMFLAMTHGRSAVCLLSVMRMTCCSASCAAQGKDNNAASCGIAGPRLLSFPLRKSACSFSAACRFCWRHPFACGRVGRPPVWGFQGPPDLASLQGPPGASRPPGAPRAFGASRGFSLKG